MSYLQKIKQVVVIATNYTVTTTDEIICLNNAATTITVTMPSAANNLGRTIALFRYGGSTGTVNVNPQVGESIQSITGAVGTSTSIAVHGANGQGVYHYFTALRVGAIFVWCRI